MRFVSLLLISIVFVSSCSTKYEAEIVKIDQLLAQLDSSKKQLMSLDTGLVYNRVSTCQNNLEIIFGKSDTISRENAFIIDDYSNCEKYYSRMGKKFPLLFEQIETMPRQLENLKTDLSKNLIEEDKAKEYLANEVMSAESIIQIIDESVMQYEGLDKAFNDSHEKILHLIQTLEKSDENDLES